MKSILLIMAVILLVLSCLPCVDNISSSTTTSELRVADCDSENNEQTDHCSPLCVCSCCATTVTFSLIAESIHKPLAEPTNYHSYLPAPIFEISLPVWQPPQLPA